MEDEQLVQRVEWLDEERRQDKSTVADLQKKIAKLEGMLDKSEATIKELGSEVTRLGVLVAKVTDFEASLTTHRQEVKKQLDEREKQAKQREDDAKKLLQLEIDDYSKTLDEFRLKIDEISKLKEANEARRAEEARLERAIGDLKRQIEELRKAEEGRESLARTLGESQRQDSKRVTDVQAEVSALRKRSDEFRGQLELALDSQRNTDTRINEIQAAEAERREIQKAFTEKWTLELAQREKAIKEWEKQFKEIDSISQELGARLQAVSISERDVKRAQETFEEITNQINRRINEITEMQRIGDERFRQEWATFKAEDQKRWTNHMLSQEELQGENARRIEKLFDQITKAEDDLQELQDVVKHLSDQSEKRLQTLLASVRDWVTENERFKGGSR